MHKNIINDQGIPELKKRSYQMPGYKKILKDEERDVIETAKVIQNQLNDKQLKDYIIKEEKKKEKSNHKF